MSACEHHYDAFIVLVDSFLEAVQGLPFNRRFEKRMDQLVVKLMKSLAEKLAKDLEQLGVKAQEIKFHYEQIQILSHQIDIWGKEKTTRFIDKYIIPLIKDETDIDISTEKLLALIALFESEVSGQN